MKIAYLGEKLTQQGIQADNSAAEGITNLPGSTNKEMQ